MSSDPQNPKISGIATILPSFVFTTRSPAFRAFCDSPFARLSFRRLRCPALRRCRCRGPGRLPLLANHLAIHSFCQSLSDYLSQRHATYVPPTGVPALPSASFTVLSSSKFSSTDAIASGTVSLFLHRVTIDNHLRNTRDRSPVGPLGLDLHLLLTIWADDADDEHSLLGWAMRELHQHAFLDRSSLSAEAQWAVDEQVNIAPAELPPEEMARIWEAAHRGYRLSHPFVARVIRIDPDRVLDGAPTVATRFSYADRVRATAP